LGLRLFIQRIRRLFREPVFIALTVLGNGSIALGALVLYLLESGTNPHMKSFLDSVLWSVGIVTTVGAGELQPVTALGKIVVIIMMVSGTALFWSYLALFAGALLSVEIGEMGREMRHISTSIRDIVREEKIEFEDVHQLIGQLETTLEELKILRDKSSSKT